MNLSLIAGYDRTTLEFMLEQDIPEETKVAIRAELHRRTSSQRSRELIGRLLNQKRMYLFLIGEACDCLTSLLSEDQDEIHPEATIVRDRLAAALAAAQAPTKQAAKPQGKREITDDDIPF